MLNSSLARASLAKNWRLTWFSISILILAGVVMYIQLAAGAAQILSYGAFERQAKADIIILHAPTSKWPFPHFRPLKAEVASLVSGRPGIDAIEIVEDRRLSARLETSAELDDFIGLRIIDLDGPALSAPRSLSNAALGLLRQPGAVIITEADARKHGIRLGDQLTTRSQKKLRVVATIRGGLGEGESLVSLRTAQLVDPRPPLVSQSGDAMMMALLAASDSSADPERVGAALSIELKPYGAIALTRDQFANQIRQQILRDRRDVRGFLIVALFMVLATGVIVTQAALSSIVAQRAQFATLLALGVARWRIAALILHQCAWIGVLGAAFAVSGALLAQAVLSQLNVDLVMLPIFVPLVSATLIGSALLGGGLAALSAMSIRPIELLR